MKKMPTMQKGAVTIDRSLFVSPSTEPRADGRALLETGTVTGPLVYRAIASCPVSGFSFIPVASMFNEIRTSSPSTPATSAQLLTP